MTEITPPLKWHGGKHYLASKIIALMPTHIHYVEPYAGGLSVLLAKNPEGVSEVVNDLNGELTNFWRVLQSDIQFLQFVRLSEATAFSENEWNASSSEIEYREIPGFDGYRAGNDGTIWSCWARDGHGWRYGTKPVMGDNWKELSPYQSVMGYLRYTLVRGGEKRLVGGHILVLEAFSGARPIGHEACHNNGNASDNRWQNLRWDTHSANEKDKTMHRSEAWRAWRFFIRCRQSLAGRFADFATLSRSRTRRNMNEQASAWMNAVDGLPLVHNRLRRVVILNHDALKVIEQQDGPATLFYLDPPYLHKTRVSKDAYAHEMSREQHADLLTLLGKVEGKFLLSGYDSELYRLHEKANGWTRHEFNLPNHAAGGSEKRKMKEVVWCNFKESNPCE